MNNSQFWTWNDHWQGWDWMREELETELELAEWCDETLWMICLICGNSLNGCICEDAVPTPPPIRGPPAPLPVSLILSISRFLGALDPDWNPGRPRFNGLLDS